MAKHRKPTVPDILGWLLGIGCVIHAILREWTGYFPPTQLGASEEPWLNLLNSPRIELWFGVLLIMGVSWIKKTGDEASDDMEEADSETLYNTRPRSAADDPVTLQDAAFRGYFGPRLLSLLVFVFALLAFYITTNPGVPSFVVFLVSPGSVLGPRALPRYGASVAFPSDGTLGINCLYFGAIFWLLFFRRRV